MFSATREVGREAQLLVDDDDAERAWPRAGRRCATGLPSIRISPPGSACRRPRGSSSASTCRRRSRPSAPAPRRARRLSCTSCSAFTPGKVLEMLAHLEQRRRGVMHGRSPGWRGGNGRAARPARGEKLKNIGRLAAPMAPASARKLPRRMRGVWRASGAMARRPASRRLHQLVDQAAVDVAVDHHHRQVEHAPARREWRAPARRRSRRAIRAPRAGRLATQASRSAWSSHRDAVVAQVARERVERGARQQDVPAAAPAPAPRPGGWAAPASGPRSAALPLAPRRLSPPITAPAPSAAPMKT